MPESEVCYLKATEACVKRGFLVPNDDAWIYAVSSSLLATICGDCRMWVKTQKQKSLLPVPAISS